MVPKLEPEMVEKVMLKAGLKPLEPYKRNDARWKCKCLKCNRTVYPSYANVVKNKSGCGYCAKKKVDPKEAMAIMKKAGFKPLEPYKKSNQGWKCECLKCGQIVHPHYSTVQNGGGCISCSGFAKLDHTFAESVMLKAGLKPLEPYKNARAKWKCECLKCNNIVHPRYHHIKRGKGGCIYCAKGQYVDPKFAEKVMLKAGLKPLEPYTKANARWKCKCLKCSRTVYPSYSGIQQGGGGCGYCAKIKIDLEDVMMIMLEAKLEPLEEYKGATARWKCKCLRCNKTVYPNYSGIQQGGGGCKYCAIGQYVDPEDARKIMIDAGYKPNTPYKSSIAKWECIHIPCGKTVYPNFGAIQGGRGACRTCAKSGFQYNKQSYLYLITHKDFGAHKVGIGNVVKYKYNDRINRHKEEGWEVFQVWNFDDGYKVMGIETEIFRTLRKDLDIPQFLVKEQMKFSGETETMDAELISLPDLKKIINKCIKKGLKE
jgi:hypothetical protein